MKKQNLVNRLLSMGLCLMLLLTAVPAVSAAAQTAEKSAQSGSQDVWILLLSGLAIIGLVLLYAIRWSKRRSFE